MINRARGGYSHIQELVSFGTLAIEAYNQSGERGALEEI